MYETVKMEKDEIFAKYIKEQWHRYLDDCFILWERSMNDFTYFENLLNSSNADIHFLLSCVIVFARKTMYH